MSKGSEEREDKLLAGMMSYLMDGKDSVSFLQLSKDLDFMERTKSWRNSWKVLLDDKKFIEPVDPSSSTFTGDHKLTQAGKDHASTPEYVEYLKDLNFVAQSNEEHQDRIKKRLKNEKAVQIFDLLLKHGSLGRTELSTLLHCNDRSHKFSYGLQGLRKKGYVEMRDKKFRLTDAAFKHPSDRPEPVEVDAKDMADGKAYIESKKISKSSKTSGNKDDSSKKSKKRKNEEDDFQSPSKMTKTEDRSEDLQEEVIVVEE